MGVNLEHDPEKWEPVFGKSMPSGLTRGIMLKRQSGSASVQPEAGYCSRGRRTVRGNAFSRTNSGSCTVRVR